MPCLNKEDPDQSKTTQSDQGHLYSSLYSTVSVDSVIGHRRPCSDCTNAQVSLGLQCLYKI